MTVLLPLPEAKIYSCFEEDSDIKLTEEQLKSLSGLFTGHTNSSTLFYDSLSALIQLNLVESIT